MQIFVHSVERLNSPVYSVPPCRYSLPIFVCFYFIFACFLSGLSIIFWHSLHMGLRIISRLILVSQLIFDSHTWNSLPSDIIFSHTLHTFDQHLKTHLLTLPA